MRLAWVRGNWSSRGPPPGPGWRNPSPWRTIPPPMSLLAFLLVAQTATQDTVRPYLAFPEPGLDDPAAYEGYATRVYQDASHNAFQVYLKGNTGRVAKLGADAANESVGFTVLDSTGRPAEQAWASSGAVVARSAQTPPGSYALWRPAASRSCAIGEPRHKPAARGAPRAPDRTDNDGRAGPHAARAGRDLQRRIPSLFRAGPCRYGTPAAFPAARARSAGRRAAVLPREADGGAARPRRLFRS